MRPILALVHGLGDDHTAWNRLVPSLVELGDVVIVELPGFGAAKDVPAPLPLAAYAESLWEQVRRQSTEIPGSHGRPVVLIGHSLGGALVTLMAEAHASDVAGVLDIEGNLTAADCFFSGQAVFATDYAAWFTSFRSRFAGRYGVALGQCDRATFRALSNELVARSADDALLGCFMSLPMPKRYVHGTEGFPGATAAAIAGRTDVVVAAGSGHWVMEDAPDVVIGALHDVLSEVAPPVPADA